MVYNFIHKNKYANFKSGVCLRPYMLSQLVYTHTEMSWTLWRVKSRLFNKDTEIKKTTLLTIKIDCEIYSSVFDLSLARAHIYSKACVSRKTLLEKSRAEFLVLIYHFISSVWMQIREMGGVVQEKKCWRCLWRSAAIEQPQILAWKDAVSGSGVDYVLSRIVKPEITYREK